MQPLDITQHNTPIGPEGGVPGISCGCGGKNKGACGSAATDAAPAGCGCGMLNCGCGGACPCLTRAGSCGTGAGCCTFGKTILLLLLAAGLVALGWYLGAHFQIVPLA